MKILHIEDSPEIQTTVELLFKVVMPEASLYTAGTGSEGIDVVRYSQPDIVLLDLGLPDISGYEVITRVRELSPVPIVIMTARREEAVRAKCFELGADDFIVKPFNHKEVIESINAILTRKAETINSALGT